MDENTVGMFRVLEELEKLPKKPQGLVEIVKSAANLMHATDLITEARTLLQSIGATELDEPLDESLKWIVDVVDIIRKALDSTNREMLSKINLGEMKAHGKIQ